MSWQSVAIFLAHQQGLPQHRKAAPTLVFWGLRHSRNWMLVSQNSDMWSNDRWAFPHSSLKQDWGGDASWSIKERREAKWKTIQPSSEHKVEKIENFGFTFLRALPELILVSSLMSWESRFLYYVAANPTMKWMYANQGTTANPTSLRRISVLQAGTPQC